MHEHERPAMGSVIRWSLTLVVVACASALPSGPSALHDPLAPALPPPLVDPNDLVAGGPPPDGILPIDEPRFTSVDEAGQWLATEEPVVYVEAGGDVHAYPVQIMIWHEIVNDTIGGVPVTVTYCPLCNSAISFVREIDGVETTFGTSGLLYASALVMYDRATESLWTHYNGKAVAGVLTGRQLVEIPSPLLSWTEFAAAFPEALVLDRDRTGSNLPYGENPYDGYEDPAAVPSSYRGEVDNRALPRQRVVGVEIDGEASAWTLDALRGDGAAGVTPGSVGGRRLVVFWRDGQVSALDTQRLVSGRSVGSVGVFDPTVDERTLTFTATDDGFVDGQTRTTWDITGSAIDGPLTGTRLERIPHLDTFWFAWSAYHPDTVLIDG